MSETNAEMLRRLRADAVARGLCYVCRCRFPRPGVRCCDDCIARNRRSRPSEAAKSKRAAAVSRRGKEVRANRKELGLCPDCGRRPPEIGRAACSVCLDYNAAAQQQRNRRIGHAPHVGACSVCRLPGHNKRRHERAGVPL